MPLSPAGLQQIEREKDLLMTSPKERFQKVHKRSPHLFQEIPNKYIASYLFLEDQYKLLEPMINLKYSLCLFLDFKDYNNLKITNHFPL